ncbi:MAG: hypothetical protein AAFZ80_05985, partial [Cyanobacteria bacterium P01_A01_bin.105]
VRLHRQAIGPIAIATLKRGSYRTLTPTELSQLQALSGSTAPDTLAPDSLAPDSLAPDTLAPDTFQS